MVVDRTHICRRNGSGGLHLKRYELLNLFFFDVLLTVHLSLFISVYLSQYIYLSIFISVYLSQYIYLSI